MALLCVGRIGKLYIRSEKEPIRNPSGDLVHPGERRLEVEFVRGGTLPEYARKKALEKLDITGLPENADPMSALTWLDTAVAAHNYKWTPEEQAAVEAVLRERDGNGFIVVDVPKVQAPYANYRKHRNVQGRRTIEHAIADIQAVFEQAGFDVGQAVEFEKQNPDKDTETVVAALLALQPVEEPEPEPLMAA